MISVMVVGMIVSNPDDNLRRCWGSSDAEQNDE
jgi:hypothetical protein